MNIHQHARMTVHGRALLVNRILVEGWRVADAAQAAGVSERCAYTWLARYRAGGERMPHDRSSTSALLKELIFGPTGCAMSPTHIRKGGRLYSYYFSQAVLKQGRDACLVGRLPAAEIETAVID